MYWYINGFLKWNISKKASYIVGNKKLTRKICVLNLRNKSFIKFKTTILKSSLCDYSDAYILVTGTITVNNTAAEDADANNTNKKVIFKTCAPFTNCISEINNTQVDKAKDIDIVMPMYNLIEYSNNYAKTSKSLWQY